MPFFVLSWLAGARAEDPRRPRLEPQRAFPVLVNEDDHYGFNAPDGRLTACVAEYVSWAGLTGGAPVRAGELGD